MTTGKKLRAVIFVLAIFIVLPIWYYLLYKILHRVDATELMWFLYWVYLPVGILIGMLREMVKQD